MAKLERIYRCTESGLKAWQSQDPALPAEDRRILGLIQRETHWDVMRSFLRRHWDRARLADLEARGWVVSEAVAPGHDLDFTGTLALSNSA
jgi:hypothetical protein